MRAFADLTAKGQERRVRSLALAALSDYGWPPDGRCSVAARSFNLVFRVDWPPADDAYRAVGRGPAHRVAPSPPVLGGGHPATLRAGRPAAAFRIGPEQRIHPDGTEMVEAAWMAALRRDAGVATPGVYLATDGSPVVWARHPTVPGRRAAMLFEWINGRPLYQVMTESRAQQLGTLSARLHQHASTSALPSPPSVLIADRVLYWRVDDRLSELAPMYGSLFTEAHARAQDAVDTLWRNPPHRPHLVHGDLSGSNVIVRRDRLVAIDFQDLVWGLDIQDLAITLTSLRRFDDCEHLIASLRCGYEAVRPWPDPDPSLLAALIAGRRLHQLNLTLNLRRPGYEQAIARAAALIRDWMAVPV